MARIETDPNYTAPTFSRATAGTDLFKATDVQSLAAAMSTHDHASGRGVQINGNGIANNSIFGTHIVDGQVGTADIGDGTITNVKHTDRSILAGKIALSTITNAEIASNTITDGLLSTTLVPTLPASYSVNQGAVVPTVTGIGGGYGVLGVRRTYGVAITFNSAGSAGQVIEFKLFSGYTPQLHGGGAPPNYFINGIFQFTTAGGVLYWGYTVPYDANTLRFICTAQGAAWGWFGINPAITIGVNDRLAVHLPMYI